MSTSLIQGRVFIGQALFTISYGDQPSRFAEHFLLASEIHQDLPWTDYKEHVPVAQRILPVEKVVPTQEHTGCSLGGRPLDGTALIELHTTQKLDQSQHPAFEEWAQSFLKQLLAHADGYESITLEVTFTLKAPS